MWLTNLFGKVKNISSDLSNELTKSLRLRLCSKCPQKRNYFIDTYSCLKKEV
jgi:hypothetical protein